MSQRGRVSTLLDWQHAPTWHIAIDNNSRSLCMLCIFDDLWYFACHKGLRKGVCVCEGQKYLGWLWLRRLFDFGCSGYRSPPFRRLLKIHSPSCCKPDIQRLICWCILAWNLPVHWCFSRGDINGCGPKCLRTQPIRETNFCLIKGLPPGCLLKCVNIAPIGPVLLFAVTVSNLPLVRYAVAMAEVC